VQTMRRVARCVPAIGTGARRGQTDRQDSGSARSTRGEDEPSATRRGACHRVSILHVVRRPRERCSTVISGARSPEPRAQRSPGVPS
jgi:hypothetical protein